jgi:hypothetical protein
MAMMNIFFFFFWKKRKVIRLLVLQIKLLAAILLDIIVGIDLLTTCRPVYQLGPSYLLKMINAFSRL